MPVEGTYAGEWLLAEGFRRRGEARESTHRLDTAEEFIASVIDEPRWRYPSALQLPQPSPATLTILADRRFQQRESPRGLATDWLAFAARFQAEVSGTWDLDEKSDWPLRFHPAFEKTLVETVYFDHGRIDEFGSLQRRLVVVGDGVYVDEINVWYQRPGRPAASHVDAYARTRLQAVHAIINEVEAPTGPSVAAISEAEHSVRAMRFGAEHGDEWVRSREALEIMSRLRARLLRADASGAAWRNSLQRAVGEYFEALRASGVTDVAT